MAAVMAQNDDSLSSHVVLLEGTVFWNFLMHSLWVSMHSYVAAIGKVLTGDASYR